MSQALPNAKAAKDEARAMRLIAAKDGAKISHAAALEAVAHAYGYRDWNTLSAAIAKAAPMPWAPGDKVTGRYIAQPFTAEVLQVTPQERRGWFRIKIDLDTPVDVVTSAHFSNMRSRISGVVGPKGLSAERTSDGAPQLQIDLP